MATTQRKGRRIKMSFAQHDAGAANEGRPWLTLFAIGMLAALALVWAAPWVIASTPLLGALVSRAVGGLNGSVTVGQASLGWLSPIVVQDVTVADSSGKSLLQIKGARTEKSLLALLLNARDLGKLRVEQPALELVLSDNSSNVEGLLGKLLNGDSSTSTKRTAVSLEVIDGSLTLRDTSSGGQWNIKELNSVLSIPAESTWPTEATIVAQLEQQGVRRPLQLSVSAQDVQTTDGPLVSTGKVVAKTDHFPLSAVQAVARRFVGDLVIAGDLTTALELEWGTNQDGASSCRLAGESTIEQLVFGGGMLSGDQLRLNRIHVPHKLQWQGDALTIDQVNVFCDVGEMALQATIPSLTALRQAASAQVFVDQLARCKTQLATTLDLAKLAPMLSRTLRVRDDTKITSGSVTLQVSTTTEPNKTVWFGVAQASRLVALHAGKELAWDKPLKFNFSIQDESGRLSINNVQCVSDFLQIDLAGSADDLRLSGSCDLNRLTGELGRFVDLGGIRLEGQGTGNVTLRNQPTGLLDAAGHLSVQRFQLALPSFAPLSEEQLTLNVTAALTQQKGWPKGMQTGQLTLDAGGDRLLATLTQPVDALDLTAKWPLTLQLQGTTVSWLRRLSPLFTLPLGWDFNGQLQGTTSALVSSAAVELSQTQLQIQPLVARLAGLVVQEPLLRLVGGANWQRLTQRIEVPQATLETGSAALHVQNGLMIWAKGSEGASGRIRFNGDIAALSRYGSNLVTPANWQYSGTLQGEGQLALAAGVTSFELDTTAQNLSATPRQGRQIMEPAVKLTVKGSYQAPQQTLDIKQCELLSDAVAVQLAGDIRNLSTTRDAQLTGQLNYDLAKVSRLLTAYWGNAIQLSGRESRPFSLAGPLAPPPGVAPEQAGFVMAQQLKGKAQLGWQWANVLGFNLGATTLEGELGGGLFRVKPTELAVGQGRARLSPEVRLGPQQVEFVQGPITMLEQIELTPEMCNQWLGHIAPLLAGVTQAQGRFSLHIDAARIPLANWQQGDIAGRLTIHQVEIGPGGWIMQQIAQLLGGGSAAKLSRESTVPFRIVQGRVYHQNLELSFPEVTIRTQGSVGFDQSLALMVEMPFPQPWLANHPQAQLFKDQVIRIPVAGTLQRPVVDGSAVGRALTEVTAAAAKNAARQEVNRGLDKLLEKIPMLPGLK